MGEDGGDGKSDVADTRRMVDVHEDVNLDSSVGDDKVGFAIV